VRAEKPSEAAEEAVESSTAEKVREVAHVDDALDERRNSGTRDATALWQVAAMRSAQRVRCFARKLDEPQAG
jgi:hypothetical protein